MDIDTLAHMDRRVDSVSQSGGTPLVVAVRTPDHSGKVLGVGLTDLTPELREHFGVGGDAGVMISRVVEDSPAAKAGLRVGDIIERKVTGQLLIRF